MKINKAIQEFVDSAIASGYVSKEDRYYLLNRVLYLVGEESFESSKEVEQPSLLDAMANLVEAAVESGKIENDSEERDWLEQELMNLVIPKPSELNRLFWDKYEEGPKVATDAFYKIALDLNLIKVKDIAKNISFNGETEYGDLEITINLSKPEKTKEVITEDGWFKTGDLATIDNEGFVTIRGRRNTMIVLSNGKNIDPETLEDRVLKKSDGLIKEIGIFNHKNKLAAIIVPDLLEFRKRNITNTKTYIKNIVEDYNLKAHNYEKILDYKLFENELPKTRVGKTRRFMLPDLYEKGETDKKEKVIEPDNEIYRILKEYVKKNKGIAPQPQENLELEIGMDSLDIVEFFAYIESNFGIRLDEDEFSKMPNLLLLSEYINQKATKIEDNEVDWKKIIDETKPIVDNKNRWVTKILKPLQPIVDLYFRTKKINKKNLTTEPQIFVSNHQSFVDPVVLGTLLPRKILNNTLFLAIDWYFKKGFMKLLVNHGNVILVDINKNIRKSVEEIVGHLKSGKSVLIFPEGARSKDGKVAEFKKVFAIIAKEMDVDIQCLGIKGAFNAYSRYMKFPRPKKIEVAVLEKFKPSGSYDEICKKAQNIIKKYVEN